LASIRSSTPEKPRCRRTGLDFAEPRQMGLSEESHIYEKATIRELGSVSVDGNALEQLLSPVQNDVDPGRINSSAVDIGNFQHQEPIAVG
jgi:hypothetical protein